MFCRSQQTLQALNLQHGYSVTLLKSVPIPPETGRIWQFMVIRRRIVVYLKPGFGTPGIGAGPLFTSVVLAALQPDTVKPASIAIFKNVETPISWTFRQQRFSQFQECSRFSVEYQI